MNRRNFLKTAGIHAGAVALTGPGMLGASPRAQAPAIRTAAGTRLTADVAVIGAGVFGGWTALCLREMGHSVILIDQYGPGNSKSSSGGEVRGMRANYRANQEHFTRWAIAAMEQWRIREAEFGTTLYYESGVLGVSRAQPAQSLRTLFDTLRFPYEILTRDDLAKRWPQVATEDAPDVVGFYQPRGGTLKAHASCVAVASAFRKKGGRFVLAKASLAPDAKGTLQRVLLSSGETVSAGTFIFAAGPWLLTMFPDLLDRKLLVAKCGYGLIGLPPDLARDYSYPVLPNTSAMLPNIDGLGLAVPLTVGKTPVDPDTHDRVPTAEDKADVLGRTARWFPALKGQPFINAHVCQLENTVDENFIIDRHPGFDNVWLAGGGSFHGFKFGPVTGDYVAHRVVGRDKQPELAPIFRIKPQTFADATGRNP